MLQGFIENLGGLRTAKKDTKISQEGRCAPSHKGEAGPGTGDDRLDTLNALLANPHFRASPRNKRFLEFVVKETVAGRAERIKAFTVAIDVFGRGEDFDALSDPIVRISAGHLRRALDTYYATHGNADPMRIHLPRGTYVPTFEKRENLRRRMLRRMGGLAADRRQHLRSGAAGVALALSAAGIALGYLSYDATRQHPDQQPVVVIDSARMPDAKAGMNTLAHLFTRSLWAALTEGQEVRVIGVRAEEDSDAVLRDVRRDIGNEVALYRLVTAVKMEGRTFQVDWEIRDGRSNEAYLSASASADLLLAAYDAAPERIARTIAAALGELPREKRFEPRLAKRMSTGRHP